MDLEYSAKVIKVDKAGVVGTGPKPGINHYRPSRRWPAAFVTARVHLNYRVLLSGSVHCGRNKSKYRVWISDRSCFIPRIYTLPLQGRSWTVRHTKLLPKTPTDTWSLTLKITQKLGPRLIVRPLNPTMFQTLPIYAADYKSISFFYDWHLTWAHEMWQLHMESVWSCSCHFLNMVNIQRLGRTVGHWHKGGELWNSNHDKTHQKLKYPYKIEKYLE